MSAPALVTIRLYIYRTDFAAYLAFKPIDLATFNGPPMKLFTTLTCSVPRPEDYRPGDGSTYEAMIRDMITGMEPDLLRCPLLAFHSPSRSADLDFVE